MSDRELDAAGITDPAVRLAYARCKRLNASYGKTFYLATRLLTPAQRPAVHALYGFARWADEIVDSNTSAERGAELDRLEKQLDAQLDGRRTDHPVLAALADTVERHGIERGLFTDFLASMRMDLEVTEYADLAALGRYVHGSAAVIGLQMLPVLEFQAPLAIVRPYAIDLGVAFQLTNFLRDVGEDLRRGRIYLPQDSLRRHGVDRERLQRGVVDGPIRRLMADEIARTRELYRSAEQGIRLLDPTSRPCVQTAFTLYRGILDEIERRDYRVLDQRVSVGMARRARVAVPGLVAAALARRG